MPDIVNDLNRLLTSNGEIEIQFGDYTQLHFEDNSADSVYALESCCHCEELDKGAFVNEMMRVLKPAKRFVIVDGFLKRDPSTFHGLVRYCYTKIIKGWALPSFPHVGLMTEAIKNAGGDQIEVKDYSFRVAPSVFHSPITVIFFLIKKMLNGEKLNPVRIGHLKACLLGLILGMHRKHFSYCLVTGIKK